MQADHPPGSPVILRVEVDFGPWRSGADLGLPARLMNLLELAMGAGYKIHAFVSLATIHSLPALVEAFLNEGHDIDFLDGSGSESDWEEAKAAIQKYGARLFLVLKTDDALPELTGASYAQRNPPGARVVNPLDPNFSFPQLREAQVRVISQRELAQS